MSNKKYNAIPTLTNPGCRNKGIDERVAESRDSRCEALNIGKVWGRGCASFPLRTTVDTRV